MDFKNDILWEFKKPPHEKEERWLKELQAMRGEALYQDGLRPFFKISDNTFDDADEFDSIAYHILAKYNDQIVGGVRLLVLDKTFDCVSGKIVNQASTINHQPISFSSIISELFPGIKMIEASRFVVRRGFQSVSLHQSLLAIGWLLMFKFDGQMIGNAGFKASYLMQTAGAQFFPKYAGPYKSDMYNDEVYLLFFDKNNISNEILLKIHEMKELIVAVNINQDTS